MSSENVGCDKNINYDYKAICCENIPELFLDKLIAKKHFSKFGKINRFIFCPKRLSCTVEYVNKEDAKNAYENAGNYNGFYFDVRYAANEVAHTQNTEEWVNSEVQAELDAMGNTIRNPSRFQQQRLKMPTLSKISKSIAKPYRTAVISTTTAVNTTNMFSVTNNLSETSKIDLSVKQELESILKKQAFNAEDKFKILDARDKLIRLTTTRTTDIKKAVSTKGTCPDMCPEKERLLRESKHQVSSFEMDTNKNIMNHKIAIKEYSRSSADQETPLAHELRPEPILKMTMTYLMHNIMDICDDPNTNLGDWYTFVWDRTRSIRKDITQQELCSLESVELVEQCARFHIHCAARLIAEDSSVFDQKINTENLTKCLQTLKYMYHDLRIKNIKCPNESEFRAYVILLNLNDGNFLWELKQLPNEIQNSNEIREALSFYLAIDSHNYVKFFKLVKRTTYMNACILLRYFNQVRDMATRIIMKAYYSPKFYSISLDYLRDILAFESSDETVSFLRHYGLECNNKKVLLDKNAFYEPETQYIMDRSYAVESKRQTTVGEAVCGHKLDSTQIFEKYKPHDSFDEYGFLKQDAWTAQDQYYSESSRLQCTSDNLFKIPRSSPPISPKQQQLKLTQFGTKFNQNCVTKPIFPLSTTTNSTAVPTPSKFLFAKMDCTNSPAALFSSKTVTLDKSFLPHILSAGSKDFSQKTSSTKESSKNIFSGVSFQTIPKPAPNFTTNVFGSNISNENKNLPNVEHETSSLSSYQNSAFVKPKSKYNADNSKKIKEAIELNNKKTENNQNQVFKADKLHQPEIEISEFEKHLKKENEKKKEEEKPKQEELEKENQKRKERLKEIKTNSKKIYEEILDSLLPKEILEILKEEIISYEKLIKISRDIQENILEEQIHNILQEIIEEEFKIYLRYQEILRKYFLIWKDKVKKRIERKKLIQSTPIWITEESVVEQAINFNHSFLNETLGMMTRYRLGMPGTFNLITKHNEKINLTKLFSNELENKVRINDLGLVKRKTYFKCVLSLPEEPQNDQEHENSKGFYEYINICLKKLLLNQNDFETTDRKEFLYKCDTDICYCIRKVHGIYPKNEFNEKVTNDCDNSNAILFIMTCSNLRNTQKRLRTLLNLSCIPRFVQNSSIAILIYNSTLSVAEIEDKLNIHDLIKDGLMANYKIFELFEKENRCNMKSVIEECFKYLINSFEPNNELKIQNLPTFFNLTIGDEFWNRLSNSFQINPSFIKFCTQPNNVIQLQNYAIQHLIQIVEEDFNDYPEFPEEFKKIIDSNDKLMNYHDIPLDIEYFPNNWKKLQSDNVIRIKNFLLKIKLPKFKNFSLNDSNDLKQLESLILSYTQECIQFNKDVANKIGYNAIKILLDKLFVDNSKDFKMQQYQQSAMVTSHLNYENLSWLEIIKCIALGIMIFLWDRDSEYLPKQIIYNKSLLNDFIFNPWWLKIDSLKEIKMILLVRSSPQEENIKNKRSDELDYKENNNEEDDDETPKLKRMKSHDLTKTTIEQNELDKLLQKGYAMIQKANRNIENFKEISKNRRKISKDLDVKFYRQEKINQSLRKFLYENQN